jgi:hypothetical protein
MKKSPLNMGGDFFMPLGNREFMNYGKIFGASYWAGCSDISSHFAAFYALHVFSYMS